MRSVPEWIGKTDDTPPPPRVMLRVFLRGNGRCAICTRKIASGDRWVCDHTKALINGGKNREGNLQPICDWCDRKVKTPADVAEKSRTYAKQLSQVGIKKKPKGRPLIGTKASGWKHKVDGSWERRP
jgi:5-methylcytosine-specific restriction endonuclease McrA